MFSKEVNLRIRSGLYVLATIVFFVLLWSGMLLTKSSRAINISMACSSQSEFCAKLSEESMCKRPREIAIIDRYILLDEPSEKHQFNLLESLDSLSQCYEHASKVEYINADIRFQGKSGIIAAEDIEKRDSYSKNLYIHKQQKIKNYTNSIRELASLEYKTRNSNDPHILYWRWTRKNDIKAAEMLEAYYDQGIINDHDLLFYLSQYLYRKDTNKSITAALKALEVYPENNYKPESNAGFDRDPKRKEIPIHITIFQSLANHYYQKKMYELSYVFSELLEINNNNTADITMIEPLIDKGRIKILKSYAKKIDKAISNGKFKSTMIRKA
jgi:hypothetical protein